MNPLLRASAAHVFVASLDAPMLDEGDLHHLKRVLRIRATDPITISDGVGGWLPARLVHGRVEPAGEPQQVPEPAHSTLASAIPKGDRAEWLVQKVTELGVSEIVLGHFARSVVRWEGDRLAKQRARLQRVAREAAMQSRRVWLPKLVIGESFAQLSGRPHAALADPDGHDALPGRCLIIGPEGGFDPAELDVPLPRIRLTDTVLRTETAAVVGALRVVFAGQGGEFSSPSADLDPQEGNVDGAG